MSDIDFERQENLRRGAAFVKELMDENESLRRQKAELAEKVAEREGLKKKYQILSGEYLARAEKAESALADKEALVSAHEYGDALLLDFLNKKGFPAKAINEGINRMAEKLSRLEGALKKIGHCDISDQALSDRQIVHGMMKTANEALRGGEGEKKDSGG